MASYKVVFIAPHEAAGIYRETGVYNSYPYYKHESKEYYIFRMGNYWYLSAALGGDPLWNKNSTDITGQWTIVMGTVAAPTVSVYEEISYVVSNAGTSYVNGEYTYAGVYNGKPYYAYRTTLPGTSYTQIFYMSWKGGTTGWTISTYLPESATGIPLYHSPTAAADSTPDEVTWEAVDGEAPAPTVTVNEGAGDAGGGVVDPEDTTIIVPDSTPEVGGKGLKVGNMFIPGCPNPVDTHLSKVSDIGKNIALGWLGFGDGVDITGLDVQFQALTDGWLSAHVTATAGGQYLELLTYRDAFDDEHAYGNTRFAYASGATLRGVIFVPRGFFYKIKSDATLIKAMWYPCKGASE